MTDGGGQPNALKGRIIPYLAEELVDIPMVLSHPFDEVIELFDEIADLPTGSQFCSSEKRLADHIVTAEVEALGPGEGQREWLPNRLFNNPSTERRELDSLE